MSDADLLERARAGDMSAFSVLHERNHGAALAVARGLSRSPADAEDLVAEGMTKVMEAIQRGNGPDDSFRPYLLTVIRHLAYDTTNRRKREEVVPDAGEDAVIDLDDPAILHMEREMVRHAFATLPERWQTVLWLTEVEGRRPQDIAPSLGLSANAAAALTYRAREGLRHAYLAVHQHGHREPRCGRHLDQLPAYVRGTLGSRGERTVAKHLESCDRCLAAYLELIEINADLRAAFPLWMIAGGLAALLGAGGAGGLLGTAASGGAHRLAKAAARSGARTSRAIVWGATGATAAALAVGVVVGAAASPDQTLAAVRPVSTPLSRPVAPAVPRLPVTTTTTTAPRAGVEPPTPRPDPILPPPADTTPPPSIPAVPDPPLAGAPPATPSPSTEPPPTEPPTTEPPTTEPPDVPPTAPPPSDPPPVTIVAPPITVPPVVPPSVAVPQGPITVHAVAVGSLAAGRDGIVALRIVGLPAGADAGSVTITAPPGVVIGAPPGALGCRMVDRALTCDLATPTRPSEATRFIRVRPVGSGPLALALSFDGAAVLPAERSAAVTVPVDGGPFVAAFAAEGHLGIATSGASVLTCDAAVAGCPDAQHRQGELIRNNDWSMVRVDVDGAGGAGASTFNSSSASLAVAGAPVHAELIWSGSLTAGGDGGPAPSAADAGTVVLRGPGGAATVRATDVRTGAMGGQYQASADVTDLVRTSGVYTVANVQTSTGRDAFGGWQLVVVYDDASLPVRVATVLTGLGQAPTHGASVTIPIGGLGSSGGAEVTLTGWEGDPGLRPETVTAWGVTLTDVQNPADDIANSTIVGDPGSNTFGVDIDHFVLPEIAAGADRAVTITGGDDEWSLGVIATLSAGDQP